MKNKINNDSLNDVIGLGKKILKLIYILLIALSIYLVIRISKELGVLKVLRTLLGILSPLFLGIVIAWLFNPFVKWLETKNIRRLIATILAYILLVGFIVIFINALIPILYDQIIDLVDSIPSIFSNLKEWLLNILENVKTIDVKEIEKDLTLNLNKSAKDLTETLPGMLLGFITASISYIGTFLVGLVIGFFLLLKCDNLGNTLLELVPNNMRNGVSDLFDRINRSLRNYVNGALLDALLVFVVSSLAFMIIGIRAPLLFGLFCGLTNVIPYVGPYIGGAPAIIVGFSQSTGIGIAVLIAIVVIQTIEGNVLQTLIISKTTKLNPVTIITGLLIFGHFFGVLGMLLSTPIIGVIKVILQFFNERYKIIKVG